MVGGKVVWRKRKMVGERRERKSEREASMPTYIQHLTTIR